MYICTWLATQIADRHSGHPHKQSQHHWPHPANPSGWTGWKTTGENICAQGGSRTPSPLSSKPGPCTALLGEALMLEPVECEGSVGSQATEHGLSSYPHNSWYLLQREAGRRIALNCLMTRAKPPEGGEPCCSPHHPLSRESCPTDIAPSPAARSHSHLPQAQHPMGTAPANSPCGGGSSCQEKVSGLCSCHAFCRPACTERACLPGLLSSCLEGFVWLFFFSPPSFSWECIVYFQQQLPDPGDNSAATRPGAGTTWTRFRHLASHKEGGKQRGSIPSAP